MRRILVLLLVVAGAVAVIVVGTHAQPGPGTTTRISESSAGGQGNGDSVWPAISDDGRYIAFASSATTLVLAGTNGMIQIFVRDRDTDADGIFDEPGAVTTTLVSTDNIGTQGNDNSGAPAINKAGTVIAFESLASNLVAADTNGKWDVFVRRAGTTTRVSVNSSTGEQGNDDSGRPDIASTPHALLFVFQSYASNLLSGDTNGKADIFVATVSGVTGGGWGQGNDDSQQPSISGDTNFITFESLASNLVSGDTNGVSDVFGLTRSSGIMRLSVSSLGQQGNGDSGYPSTDNGGGLTAFQSDADNLVSGDTNGVSDIFVRDRVAGTTERVSVNSAGEQANGGSLYPVISGDGRYVAFSSMASNLVPGDTNNAWDIFVYDRQTQTTERVSVDSGGTQANGDSTGSAITYDGGFVGFDSQATNLVFPTPDTNGNWDVFAREREIPTATPTLTATPTVTPTATATPPPGVDTDGDGCAWEEEAFGAPPPKPGATGAFDPLAWYDFYDVPAPANPDMTPNGPRNQVVDTADVLSALFYAFADDDGPPNANSVDYDSVKGSCDYNADTTPDEEGLCYDRSSSPEPNPPWGAGPPNGTVDMGDVLATLAQSWLDCSGPP